MGDRIQHSIREKQFPAAQSGFGLSIDRSGCEHQLGQVELDSHSGAPLRYLMVGVAENLKCSLCDVALACFIGILFRHVQQAAVSLWVCDEVAASNSTKRLVLSELEDRPTLADIVATIIRKPSEIPLNVAGVSHVAFGMSDGNRPPLNPLRGQPGGLALMVLDTGFELVLRIEFDGGAYRVDRLRDFLGQYQQFAEQASRSPFASVSEHSLVTDLGRSLIADLRSKLEKPRYALLTESFLACAERYPEDIAIRQAGRSWSYAELARNSEAIASYLCRSGVGIGDVIAVSGHRSYAVISAMLGVFCSGGVLLTLDPKLPIERQKLMMQEARAKLVICVGPPDAVTLEGVRAIRVDPLSGAVLEVDAVSATLGPLPILVPTSAAYVFFTSGSTGVPKAVIGTHEGLGHFLEWQRVTFDVRRNDRASQITALSFDVILRDVFLALTSGATLCIPAEMDLLDPGRILAWMEAERITILHIVPSLASAWLRHVPAGITLSHLRLVFFAGEPLTDILVGQFRNAFGNAATIINLYGPTETTLAKCYHTVKEPDTGVQPIGGPIADTQVVILDQSRHLCGVGETGEIAIRTPFRTLGYLNAPEANKRAFVLNPFRNDPDDLIYLTGDRGRLRSDGLLEIVGRIDNQVKIRGMRVELGEIESTISRYSGVRNVVVGAFDNPQTGKFLTAYLVFNDATSKSDWSRRVEEVRDALRDKLPGHMVPSSFLVLNELPLSANGKVNRRALPMPDPPAESSIGDSEFGSDGLSQREQELIAVWSSVLGREHVSANESFGVLGGDSLSAIDALVGMKRLGISDEAARGIFEGLTIRQIATHQVKDRAVDSRFASTDASVFIRALSIVLVVAGHIGLFDVPESTDALFIVSGLSFARFQLKSVERTGKLRSILSLLFRIALPTFLYTLLLQIVFTAIHVQSLLFFDNFIDPMFNKGFAAWFIEVLLQSILIIYALLSFDAVRRFAVRNPYGFGLVFLSLSWIASVLVPLVWDTSSLYNRVPHMYLWLMAFGWCVAYSDTAKKAAFCGALLLSFDAASFLLSQDFLVGRYTQWFAICAGIFLLLTSKIPLPQFAIVVVNSIAGASLFIYITHFQFYTLIKKMLSVPPPSLSVVVALIGGVAVWRLWEFGSKLAKPSITKAIMAANLVLQRRDSVS